MIPQKLSLTNFMCYRQAALDFSGIHVACLVGENGAGKSALLDAITWALWGQSRLGARRDDDLIRLGHESMEVAFTFTLRDAAYRVLRRREAGTRGRTLLDFEVRDGDGWRELVQGGVRATQRRIQDVLRVDYDTFINSAYLRQGRADEFTVKTAAERKRVLGDILGLDRWAVYQARAKSRLRAIDAEREAIRLRLDEIDAELDRRSEYRAQLEAARATVDELSEAVGAARQAYEEVESARADLRHLRSQIADQEERIRRDQEELTAVAEERASHQRRLRTYEQLLAEREEIEDGYRAYRQAVQRERELTEQLQQSVEIDERRRALESRISGTRHELEARREVTTERVDELECRLPDDELLRQSRDVEARLEHLERLAESREAARDDLNRIAEHQARLRARNEALRADMEGLRERVELLRHAEAQCPLCEQPLTHEHRMELLERIEADGQAKGDAYRANRVAIEKRAQQASALQEQIRQCDRQLEDLSSLRRRWAAVREELQGGRRIRDELEEARAALDQVQERLAAEDYALETRAELHDVLQDAEQLGYDAQAHQEARRAISDGLAFTERHAQLESVRERIADEEEVLERLNQSEARWQEALQADRQRQDRLTNRAADIRQMLDGAETVEDQLQHMRAREAEARQGLGAAQQRLAASEALEAQRSDKKERGQELDREEALYTELRTAFGVEGVPAMIIEAAVPEIEEEANRLLSRMTDGGMHVRFHTQRETKAGDVREALEITIADALGERSYENYSGGEQFRVNFAIRIALSKLLARRAGARLQTLVIDEGFGTQDAQARLRLVEAIKAVQDDFARVLVVTHIDALKDAFPVRIEVSKGAEGSAVTVV